jgi:hypothetical protein
MSTNSGINDKMVWEALIKSRPDLAETLKVDDVDIGAKAANIKGALDDFAKIRRHLQEQSGSAPKHGGTPLDQTQEGCTPSKNDDAPPYEPTKWASQEIESSTNCYAYAMNSREGHKKAPQPGDTADQSFDSLSCEDLIGSVLADGDGKIVQAEQCPYQKANQLPPPSQKGYYLVALVTTGEPPPTEKVNITVTIANKEKVVEVPAKEYEGDYHWYRQDSDGMWSHKPGEDAVCRIDADGKAITNPQTCARRSEREVEQDAYGKKMMKKKITDYKHFCCYFYVAKGGVELKDPPPDPSFEQ